ncbi:uncharacterized protein LOC118416187 [Branchiostoma floridae]|uniref:Uncharacterized protein LOC118416187 n=1 Tax=Branchiostoma floridae TaxID=7739 RepID=A0A9J7L7U5_BRAFL|nr:uncharacterized protein LOC118416187 [Branchiostoma floridae]
MKFLAVFVLLALSGACSAEPRILDTISGAITEAASSILDHAQTVGQSLVDTYVPIIGQAAQQLVGEAIQSAGTWLTDLVSGKRQVEQQTGTGIGQILQDGIMTMVDHVNDAITDVQFSIANQIISIFSPTTRKLTYGKIKEVNLNAKMHLKMDGKSTMKKMSITIAKKLKAVKSARILDQVVSALGDLVQPVLDAADQAFQNVSINRQFPYVDDANTIINSVTNHFQENYGMDTSA